MKIAPGLQMNYTGDDNGASFYAVTAKAAPASADYQHVATVVVDRATRVIRMTTPDATREIDTHGLASLKFEGEQHRVSGYSVAQYVGPRAGVLLAQLYAPHTA